MNTPKEYKSGKIRSLTNLFFDDCWPEYFNSKTTAVFRDADFLNAFLRWHKLYKMLNYEHCGKGILMFVSSDAMFLNDYQPSIQSQVKMSCFLIPANIFI